jgi:hypothetical protein
MALRLSTGLRNKQCGINTTKITNGSFTSDTTGWTATDATLTSEAGGQSGNCLQIAETGGANPGKAYQDITTKIGHLYYIELYFKKGTSDSGKFMIGTTGDEDAIYDSGALTDAAWAIKKMWFLATETTTRITLQSTDATAAETSLFDEVKVVSMSRSIQDIFKDGFIKIYTGAQPTSADDAPTGTLLVTIYSDGAVAGLEFDDAVAGVLSKKGTETWSGTAGATGTAGWFRLQTQGDGGGSSTTDERIDGACGTSGAQLNMSSTTITSGAVQSISTFQLTLPAA